MVAKIPNNVKVMWDRCNVRGSITISLSLQVFLIFLSPLRKRSSSRILGSIIWLAYLMADIVAVLTLGLISTKQTTDHDSNTDLLALWAPFCLIHLGGPDPITAYVIEDTSLWPRHLFALFFHVIIALYIFVESLPENGLCGPVSLVFLAGIVKYAERNRALFLANFAGYKGDPGFDYAKLMQEYSSFCASRLPATFELHLRRQPKADVRQAAEGESGISSVNAVFHAYQFFTVFTNLIVDQLVLRVHNVRESWSYFRARTERDAYQVVSNELNFFYDVIYTKALAIYCKLGFFFRVVSSVAIVVSLIVFAFSKKDGLQTVDVGITYLLYISAVLLEAAALVMLVFSDWALVFVKNKSHDSALCARLIEYFERIKKIRYFSVRWSNTVYGFNLIEYCLEEVSLQRQGNVFLRYCHKLSFKVIDNLGLQEFRDRLKYVTGNPLKDELWKYIFNEAKNKSGNGELDLNLLKTMSLAEIEKWINGRMHHRVFNKYELDKDYDKILVVWHVATELCFNVSSANDHQTGEDTERKFSKTLSDYMIYLMRMQPKLMLPVEGIGWRRIADTCEEAKQFITRYGLSSVPEACKRIMAVSTVIKPSEVKGNKCKSVLFEACILAKELNKMDFKERWEVIMYIWVDLLLFAASKCWPKPHAELLGKGGELVTHVWLLLTHFGIGHSLYITDDNATAKLFISS